MTFLNFGKKTGGPVLLFADPFVGRELMRRLSVNFCSRREELAENGGENDLAAGCPGSSCAAATMAGADCKSLTPREGAR